VDYFATVWVNGVQVGEHEGGYLPFELDVTAALRHDGPNELVVRVLDPGNDADFLPEFTFSEIPPKTELVWPDRGQLAERLPRAAVVHPHYPAQDHTRRAGRDGPGRMFGGQTGKQMLGALIIEVPAEMRESDDRVAGWMKALLEQPCCSSKLERARIRARIYEEPAAPGAFSARPIVPSSGVLPGREPLKSCESRHRKVQREPAV
jgi:Glycosyl hydrolases family 2, sugar binding domain